MSFANQSLIYYLHTYYNEKDEFFLHDYSNKLWPFKNIYMRIL